MDVMKRKMIAKIHIAKKDLAIEDAAYRALLERVTGKDSSASMTIAQLKKVLEEFKALGWKEKPKKRAGQKKMANSEQAGKIRALWLSLYHLGEVRDPSEDALAGYVKRMSRVADLRWLTPTKADAVIKGLRGWCERIGWDVPSGAEPVFSVKASLICAQVRVAEGLGGDFFVLAKGRTDAIRRRFRGGILSERDVELEMDDLVEKLGAEIRRLKSE